MNIPAFCLVLALTAATAAAAQDTTGAGAIAGTIRSADGRAADGVRVCTRGGGSCATTGARGTFRLSGLRAGSYELDVVPRNGLPVTAGPVAVRAGLEAVVDVALPPQSALEQTVTVTAPAFAAAEEVKNSGYLVRPLEILKSASALQDVSRYVQTLPGVVIGTSDFRNDIIVRGGSPLENLFVVDNVEIPNINAFANFASAGGTVSLLDAELIQDVTFLTGGYPAPFINRTSSVLQVTQREGRRDGFRGWATLGFAGAGAILEGPLADGRGSWIVSARRSFLDLFTDDIGIGGVPVLYSFNGKAVYDVSARDRVWLVNVSGADQIRLGARDGAAAEDEDSELFNFDIRYDGWRTATGFNWQRLFAARGVGLLGVTHSEAKVGSEVKDLVRYAAPAPGTPLDDTIESSPTVFFEDSREGETTFKYDLTVYGRIVHKLQAGGSFKIFRIDYDVRSPYGSDIPYSIDGSTDAFAVRARFTAYQTGAYVQGSRTITPRLDATVGVRVDDYQYLGDTRVSPRAAVSFRLARDLVWTASYGAYYQQPYFLFVSIFPQNRSLVPWRADHFVTGVAWQPGRAWRMTLEAYRKNYRRYPVAVDYPALSLANIGDTFNVRETLFPMTSDGRGRAEGVELFVEKQLTNKLYGQANLAIARARHAGLDGVLRPGSSDYPRVLNVSGGYRLSPKLDVSARMSWLSGRPYTPYDAALSTAQRREVYDLARVNALRAPDYFRLDLRVDRTFSLAGEPFVLFGGVQNVTNRRNFAGYEWNRRTNSEEFTEQLGVFPILGFEYRF